MDMRTEDLTIENFKREASKIAIMLEGDDAGGIRRLQERHIKMWYTHISDECEAYLESHYGL